MEEQKSWTKARVKREIHLMHNNGAKLNSGALRRYDAGRQLYQAAYRLFGNWKNALSAAGLDYYEVGLSKEVRKIYRERDEKEQNLVNTSLTMTDTAAHQEIIQRDNGDQLGSGFSDAAEILNLAGHLGYGVDRGNKVIVIRDNGNVYINLRLSKKVTV